MILTACTGGMVALQAPVNSMLGRAVGTWQAAFVSWLAVSLVVDHFGLVGVAQHPITLGEVLGVVLLAAGTYLVVREA